MADFLCPSDIDISIDEKKWLLKCRLEDIEAKGNRKWQYDNIFCSSCDSQIIETQSHILECIPLIGKSEIVTYIPNYNELFGADIQAQVYVSRLLQDNFERRIV